jgi:hypothetical protein
VSWQVYLGAFSISYASFGNGSAKLSTSVWRLPLAFMFLTAKLDDLEAAQGELEAYARKYEPDEDVVAKLSKLIQMGADEQIGQSLAGRFANFPANEFHRMGASSHAAFAVRCAIS